MVTMCRRWMMFEDLTTWEIIGLGVLFAVIGVAIIQSLHAHIED